MAGSGIEMVLMDLARMHHVLKRMAEDMLELVDDLRKKGVITEQDAEDYKKKFEEDCKEYYNVFD